MFNHQGANQRNSVLTKLRGSMLAVSTVAFMVACSGESPEQKQTSLTAIEASSSAEKTHPTEQPNVVIILTDDLGYGDVSAYNPASKIKTPHIDALAREGILFTDGHSGATVCTPSRYSLMTGEYAWRGPLRSGVLMPWDKPVIDTSQDTIAELFQSSGYETAHIGKWHLGFVWPWEGEEPARRDRLNQGWISNVNNSQFDWSAALKGGPTDHGFETYFGDDVPNFPPYAWIENDKIMNPKNMTDVPRSRLISTGYAGGIHGSGPGEKGWLLDSVTPALQNKAVEFINNRKGAEKPYFLNLWLTSPHTPIVPTREFDGSSQAGTYGDYVVQTDALVGEVVKALKDTGQFDNTLIWLTSDNGPESFAYRLMARFDHDGSAGLRGLKADSWEGGHRVPFIVSWPAGNVPKGKVDKALVSQIDIFATMATLLDAEIPEGAAQDSVDILAHLQGESETTRSSLIYHAANGNLGIRDGNWTFLQGGGFGQRPGRMWEEPQWVKDKRGVIDVDATDGLYNLESDPDQLNNVIADFPDVANELRLKLQNIIDENTK
ncbi:MAG: sulfatase family protein [Alphaproteobacteria bacterium]